MANIFGTEDFNWIKKEYNESLGKLYFGKPSYEYDIDLVLEDANDDTQVLSSNAIDSFLNIKRELLTSELEEKLFTVETEKVIRLVKQAKITQELNWKKEREEKDIYEYMKSAYNSITNYGADYVPEIHDDQVAELASKKFGITATKAGSIYVEMEMSSY